MRVTLNRALLLLAAIIFAAWLGTRLYAKYLSDTGRQPGAPAHTATPATTTITD